MHIPADNTYCINSEINNPDTRVYIREKAKLLVLNGAEINNGAFGYIMFSNSKIEIQSGAVINDGSFGDKMYGKISSTITLKSGSIINGGKFMQGYLSSKVYIEKGANINYNNVLFCKDPDNNKIEENKIAEYFSSGDEKIYVICSSGTSSVMY